VFENLTQANPTVHDMTQTFFAHLGSTCAIAVAIVGAPACKCLEQACCDSICQYRML